MVQWSTCANNDINEFGIIGDWKAVAEDAARWCETVKHGSHMIVTDWRGKERASDAPGAKTGAEEAPSVAF